LRTKRNHRTAAAICGFILLFASAALAHDIPADITIQAFLKPEQQNLRLLLRVPMKAMVEVEFPQRGPGYIDLARSDSFLRDATNLWISRNIAIFEDDAPLPSGNLVAARIALPDDKSFASYDTAIAAVTSARLPDETQLYWDQGMLDVLFEYQIRSDQSKFSIESGLARLGVRVVTVLRFLPPGGAVRAFEFVGDAGLIRLDPRWHQAALRFVELGFQHILEGTDHLLFLFCLVIPFRRLRALIPIVTSFTVAHSVTLIASAYNLGPTALWFPPLIETLIATSIVYMALENIVGSNVGRRWVITFGFGLVHGFGFSYALKQTLQFAGSYLLTSLLSFNLGVELGQLTVLVVLVPALELLFRRVVEERMGTIILSAIIAHTGWHWMIDRGEVLRQFQFQWPAMDAIFLLSVVRWLMVLVALAGALWLTAVLSRRWQKPPRPISDVEISNRFP
jgi:HupE/UreJ protein